MRIEEAGSSKGTTNCAKYSQYCTNGKPKSKDELKTIWDKKYQKSQTSSVGAINSTTTFATVTPGPTATATSSYSTLPTQQCTRGNACLNNLVPSETPLPTSTPYNVLATAGANLDIAANTAVVVGAKYCFGEEAEPPCGQTAEKAFPQLSPWGTVVDFGIGAANKINEVPANTPTQLEKTGSYVVAGVAIPTTVIPLLIFLFFP
jgi:hypothetical protein